MDKKRLDQTLVLIKPDALKNSLTGYVLSQLSEFHTGLRFAGLKVVHVSKMLADEHYSEHRDKVFFPSLIEYITGRIHYPDEPWKHRVIAIVYQGPDATKKIRDIAGPTNPHIARDEKPGCIRALGTVVPIKGAGGDVIGERMDNLIHASATDSEAEREIKLWFKPNDIPPLMQAYSTETSGSYYYFKDNKLYPKNEPGSTCFIVPGDVAWRSDLETLRLLSQGHTAPCSLEAVVAKHLINEKSENQ
jgi:nucleoside-diphosphate kinase